MSRRQIGSLALAVGICLLSDCSPDRQTGQAPIDPPAGAGAMAPNLSLAGRDVLLTWLEPEGEGHALRFARLRKGRWSEARTVAAGGDFFVNWADFPSIVEAPDGSLLAHWLARSGEGAYSYDVQLAASTDGGATWRRLGAANDDGTASEHGFVSLLPEGAGIRAFWLDGRQMDPNLDHELHLGHNAEEDDLGAMTLRTAMVNAGGPGASVEPSALLDARVCDCCQTSAAMTAQGPVVVYRDRSDAEIRDIGILRRGASGWSQPAPVHMDGWVVPGCPVNGPAVAAGGGDGLRLVVAWHTVEANRPRVQVAFSDDAGARFDEPVEVDAEQPLGRVGVVLTDEGDAVVMWLAGARGEQADIRLRRVTRDGRLGETVTAVSTSPSRASGFPRMVRVEDDLVLAWVEPVKPSRVRAVILPVRAVPPVGAPGAPGKMGGAVTAPAGHHRAWDREAGSLAPDYSALTLDGRSLSLADLRGEAVLLNLWATWCEPCRRETPDLAALQQQFRADGLRVVGVSVDVDLAPERLREYVQREKITYTILHDPDDRASGVFIGGALLPASFLFNREGVLVWSQVGLLRRDDPGLLDALAKALARPAARPEHS